jgi:anion transporter
MRSPDRAAGDPSLGALLEMDRMPLSSAGRAAQSRADRWMRYLGFPGGIAAFLLLYSLPLGADLSAAAQAGIACFALALVWWVTEPFPTYVTSLALMFLLLVTRVAGGKAILDVLGLDVIWLNLLAFILSGMFVKTRLARRLAFWLVLRFGSRATWALFAFLLLQLVLAPLIPATAARCVMTLPLMLVVAAIYGSTEEHPNAFGKNLMLLNLVGISVLSSTSMTGSSANLIAVGLIETMGAHRVYYFDWMRLGAPVAIVTTVLMWLIGQTFVFPIAPAARTPKLAGGLEVVREQYRAMGSLSLGEKKAIAIFGLVLFLWMTDVFHLRWFGVEISPPFAALLGVIIVFFPRWGVLQWAETDIPWHLLIFSAGAYAGGLALDDTGAAEWAVRKLFSGLPLGRLTFGQAFTLITAVMMYSHLLTTSKTVRALIMIPIVIALTRSLGWDPVSFALPAALTLDWVVGLPISGKPNVILFSTNQYSVIDNFKYGVVTCTIGLLILVGSAATWVHWLGVTPAFSARSPAGPVAAARATGTSAAYDGQLDVRPDGSGTLRIVRRLADAADEMSIPTGVTATGPARLIDAPVGSSATVDVRGGQAIVHVRAAPGRTLPATIALELPVSGLLTEATPGGQTFHFALLQTEVAAVPSFRLAATFPVGLRALAIRDASPKPRALELEPRAALDTFRGRRGVRLDVDDLTQGETASLQVALVRDAPSWGWLGVGALLAAAYFVGFRDLVRRTP